ncbi:hypothetical protein ES703_60803 [subsurface metagenome]
MTHLNKFVEAHDDEFPGAHFRAFDDIPLAECSEAKIEDDGGYTTNDPSNRLYQTGKFVGWNLAGKVLHITHSPLGNEGDFDIISNWDNGLELVQDPGESGSVEYHITNGGELILTRTVSSLAKLARTLGKAYTFANGCFYSDMTEPHMQAACSILYDPQIDQPLHP